MPRGYPRQALSCRLCQQPRRPHVPEDGLCGACRHDLRYGPRRQAAPAHVRAVEGDSPPPRARRRTQPRLCLRCDRRFASQGPQHRLCGRCRQILAQRDDAGPEPRALSTRLVRDIPRSP
jgi:hypothetical protein